MPDTYDDAAKRHYNDAELLASDERFDNAGQLIGFAAECALKYHFRVTASADSPKTHLPDLAATLRKRFSARDPKQAAMRALLDGYGSSFFSDWNVNERYFESGNTAYERYINWRDQTRRALGAAGFRLNGSGQA